MSTVSINVPSSSRCCGPDAAMGPVKAGVPDSAASGLRRRLVVPAGLTTCDGTADAPDLAVARMTALDDLVDRRQSGFTGGVPTSLRRLSARAVRCRADDSTTTLLANRLSYSRRRRSASRGSSRGACAGSS